jgi:hypothetical protein
MEWKHGYFDCKSNGKSKEYPNLKVEAEVSEHGIGYVEAACHKIDGNDGNKEKDASEKRIYEELYGRVVFIGSSPNGDQKIHGDEHGFPENIKENQIKGAEDTDHGRFHDKYAEHEFLHPLLDSCPGTEYADRRKQCCKENEENGDPVDTERVVDVVRWYPGDMLTELKECCFRVKTGIENKRNGEID